MRDSVSPVYQGRGPFTTCKCPGPHEIWFQMAWGRAQGLLETPGVLNMLPVVVFIGTPSLGHTLKPPGKLEKNPSAPATLQAN